MRVPQEMIMREVQANRDLHGGSLRKALGGGCARDLHGGSMRGQTGSPRDEGVVRDLHGGSMRTTLGRGAGRDLHGGSMRGLAILYVTRDLHGGSMRVTRAASPNMVDTKQVKINHVGARQDVCNLLN